MDPMADGESRHRTEVIVGDCCLCVVNDADEAFTASIPYHTFTSVINTVATALFHSAESPLQAVNSLTQLLSDRIHRIHLHITSPL